MLSLPANGGNQSNTASPRSPQSWASPSDTRKVACDGPVTPPMLSHRPASVKNSQLFASNNGAL